MPNDEREPNSCADGADSSDAKRAPNGILQHQKGDESDAESNGGEYPPDYAQDPIVQLAGWRNWWIARWWSNPHRARGNFAEYLTVFVSIVIACIAYMQYGVYMQQKKIMESSGRQTDQLIEAAEIQAAASRRIASSARRQWQAAEHFATTADTAVQDFDKAAHDSVTAANQAAANAEKSLDFSIANARIEQRPWVGVAAEKIFSFEYGKQFDARIVVKNTGKLPAFHVKQSSIHFTSPVHYDNPPLCRILPANGDFGTFAPDAGGDFSFQDNLDHFQVGTDEYAAITTGKRFLYLCAHVDYWLTKDTFDSAGKPIPPNSTTLCMEYDYIRKDFALCVGGNDMN